MSESPCGPEETRFRRAKEILHEALEREESARAAWVEEACAGDAGLAAEVLSLLEAHDPDDGFLEEPPPLVDTAAQRGSEPAVVPDRIGEFEILRLLGWGGMGVVYLAQQKQPRRQVALKVLRVDCVDETARKRFEREAQALARLHDPRIAQVYEAGVAQADIGPQPYFAMEYVDGVTIREYCRENKLGTPECFELIAKICEAVHHAHERGVLHRDLKPDNILIDSHGEPKVLDFGVAHLSLDSGQESIHTMTGQILGTIAYMSPEQARGASVDERSDQFSLGVILYQLLTQRLPFETRGYSVAQMMRTVAESEPVPIESFNPDLRGDPATIVHKALDPDPARRYSSVAGLAEDIRRFLQGRPIHARPTTTFYQVRKLVSRHRALASSLVAVILALVIGLGFALLGLREARAAEKMAQLEGDLVLRLSHVKLLEELKAREAELWPLGPDLLDDIDAWLAEAEDLERHLPTHEFHVTQAGTYAREGRLDEFLSGGARVPGGAAWFYGTLQNLVEDLRAFYSEPDGLVSEIRARRALCVDLHRLTIEGHRDAWMSAIECIRRNPAYDGLVIEEQLGLVPLGPDRASGLYEFAHFGQTGEVPLRDLEGDELQFREESAIVFVLLPGGRTWVGAQGEDSAQPNYSTWARYYEGPPREVDLAPFFLAKYELTQAQWVRMGEVNNSHWAIGDDPTCGVVDGRHPVEMVNWLEAKEFVRKLGCTLPTEAQWEYAARGGTSTAFWFGSSWLGLKGRANLTNRPRIPDDYDDDPALFDDRWDRYIVHSPVGAFPPNPFGLHDMLGNVAELCLDDYKVYYFDLPLREADALVVGDGGGDYSFRGGCFAHQPQATDPTRREELRAYDHKPTHGFRVARPLSGEWFREED